MTPPPLFLGAAVMFWGWETGLLLPAAALALLLEGARAVAWRLDFSRRDFHRISDLCTVVFAGSAIYLFTGGGGTRVAAAPRAITVLFQWLPLLVAPLVLGQAYSVAGKVDLGAFFWALRNRAADEAAPSPGALDLAYPYAVLCALSASAANVRTPGYYAGLCLFAAWALWVARSPRFSPLWWVASLALAAVTGYGGHVVLHRVQQKLEEMAFEYIASFVRRDTDPFRSTTAIGQLGQLKLSDRILLRVTPAAGQAPPILLREASYNVYSSPAWFALGAAFASVQPEADGETWRLAPGPAREASVGVSLYLPRGRGVLPLPARSMEIDRLAVVRLSKNPLGAVRVDEGLGLVTYGVRVGPGASLDVPPTDLDIGVPAAESVALSRIVAELGLASRPPAERLAAVAAFFRARFRYSNYVDRPLGRSPLEDFLVRRRAGHCEYFATATVLLLRAAGVPARYATGYSVQEWSRLERRYVVRARHAHSWALAWVDGAWRDLDTTPSVWADEEAAVASAFEPLSDVASWAVFLFSRWRYGEGEAGAARYLVWLLVPLVLVLAWRLYGRRRVGRATTETARGEPAPRHPGADSEFYRIVDRLTAAGLGRDPTEPVSAWIRRLEASGAPVAVDALRRIAELHYRYRFDPAGIGADERRALRADAEAWLAVRAGAAGAGAHD
ncbi:MAG TPA: transglutaminase domain-containing protein [Candidatus Limnocylindria bacterium]|nr:transglutaminase domain-containing protein [Candidatus Limnocylindria bacterium]